MPGFFGSKAKALIIIPSFQGLFAPYSSPLCPGKLPLSLFFTLYVFHTGCNEPLIRYFNSPVSSISWIMRERGVSANACCGLHLHGLTYYNNQNGDTLVERKHGSTSTKDH